MLVLLLKRCKNALFTLHINHSYINIVINHISETSVGLNRVISGVIHLAYHICYINYKYIFSNNIQLTIAPDLRKLLLYKAAAKE